MVYGFAWVCNLNLRIFCSQRRDSISIVMQYVLYIEYEDIYALAHYIVI